MSAAPSGACRSNFLVSWGRFMRIFSTGFLVSSLLLLGPAAFGEFKIGTTPKTINLAGDAGARVTGEAWSSDELKGKIHCLFYVDPDEKDLNDEAAQALKKEEFPKDKFTSVAVINMAASWAPNFIIQSNLEAKQKEFVDTIYVRDFKKALVKEWNLLDDSSDIAVFDKAGKVVFSKDGKLSEADIKALIKVIRENLI